MPDGDDGCTYASREKFSEEETLRNMLRLKEEHQAGNWCFYEIGVGEEQVPERRIFVAEIFD